MVSIGDAIPDIGLPSASSVVQIVTFMVFAVIFIAAIGLLTYFIINRLKYKYKIVIFENVAGKYEPTRKDVAMEVKFGDLGDKTFYVKKNKKYIPRPAKQVGRNSYWFIIDDNGLWHNIGDFSVDAPSASATAGYIDRGMLYAAVGMRKNMKERFQKVTFLERYGAMMAYIILIVIISMMMWLLIDKFIEVAQATNAGIEASNLVLDKVNMLLEKASNIDSGSSGLRVT